MRHTKVKLIRWFRKNILRKETFPILDPDWLEHVKECEKLSDVTYCIHRKKLVDIIKGENE